MKKINLLVIVLTLLFSCKSEDKLENEITQIDADVKVERVDLAFANAKPSELPKLKTAFPFIFSSRVPDSLWVEQMQDTLQQELWSEVKKEFSDFKDETNDIRSLFQHLKYYDKTFTEPRVVTVTSYVDYRNKVFVSDTIDVIALDTYLGSEHEFYTDIPRYIVQNMNKNQIVVDLAGAYSQRYIFQSQRKSLLDEMVYFGKQLYFKDKMIPFKTDVEKIGYTDEQLSWADANESQIWSYFIERELLYSTDSSLPSRFTADAPFSKFYLELDNESPGRLGQYIGWQIVRSYMENNEVTLMDMLQKDAEEIFNNSRYKPRK
ncbi:gliding motility lipoprotein GldB [Subsaxibacter sp. CAU 1640]|uniref:gliding motility lipoprotein GldB n=1 Tax=Subsaxibacter sp. CAU 1640 TaxID=2933271 RepID=UPI002004A279|nr:gliding motility lipoprotein GldB [Subsaxibacter sp. CAU 1640]MCK7590303.1 gliding motility lipoprotein GldB [Subsaxibacter sp. CAU 1640]